jgi:hypothetical protein
MSLNVIWICRCGWLMFTWWLQSKRCVVWTSKKDKMYISQFTLWATFEEEHLRNWGLKGWKGMVFLPFELCLRYQVQGHSAFLGACTDFLRSFYTSSPKMQSIPRLDRYGKWKSGCKWKMMRQQCFWIKTNELSWRKCDLYCQESGLTGSVLSRCEREYIQNNYNCQNFVKQLPIKVILVYFIQLRLRYWYFKSVARRHIRCAPVSLMQTQQETHNYRFLL